MASILRLSMPIPNFPSTDPHYLYQLPVPDDQVGWTDENFRATCRYVRKHTTFDEVWRMAVWYMDRYMYGLSPPATFWFKQALLVLFFNSPPSVMAAAYRDVKQKGCIENPSS